MMCGVTIGLYKHNIICQCTEQLIQSCTPLANKLFAGRHNNLMTG